MDAFELWCWWRLLRVPWTARRSNQYILKEISPGCSLEGLMLNLKLQYFGHLMDMSLSKLLVMDREAWHAAVRGVTKSWTWLSDWNELNWTESPNNDLHLNLDLIRNVKRDPSQPMVILLWSPLFSSPTVSVPVVASDTLNPKLLLQSCSCDFPSPSPLTPFP